MLQAARAATARVFDILDAPAERPDRRGVLRMPIHGQVTYENVSFSYATAPHPDPFHEPDSGTGVPPVRIVTLGRDALATTQAPAHGPDGRPDSTGSAGILAGVSLQHPKNSPARMPALPVSVHGEDVRRTGEGSSDAAANQSVLRNICLHAAPGEMIALVGPTGTGKSTVVNLLPAFYEPTSGRILIDGQDTSGVSLESLRTQISVVSQEPFLFNGTIRENILYGKLEATEEELFTASRAANCHEFISRLSQGYDTRVGERGVKLSVGEKQRVSIARALLKNAPILILDEATASVDTATERLIQEALERLMANRTSFVIAHRLSTIRKADQILVLRQGQIIERGTHDELLVFDGLYAKLARIQGTTFIEESFERLETTA
jgi:ABC-type multidrug transport system fused ATPase/permease subunit